MPVNSPRLFAFERIASTLAVEIRVGVCPSRRRTVRSLQTHITELSCSEMLNGHCGCTPYGMYVSEAVLKGDPVGLPVFTKPSDERDPNISSSRWSMHIP